ncbi:MAG: lactonase family protein, partial [Chloroflexota bacterium]|nr:lactonase family protein [Chloroflexota bacterium]
AVAIFDRANNGALTPAGTVPTGGRGTGGGLGNQGALTLADEGRWLLAVNPGSDDVSIFRVHADRLELTDRVMSGGTLPISVTIHDDLVYVLNDGGTANITGFRIERGGKLRLLPGSTKPLSTAAPDAAQVGFSPDGDVLVVTEKATNVISTYRVGRDGIAMGPRAQPSNGATPFGFAFLRRRDRLLVSEAAGGAPDASAVSLYDLANDGRLRVLDGSVPTTETAACWIAVTPDGRFAYAANAGSGTITGYRVVAGSRLVRLDEDGVTAGAPDQGPIDVAIDRSGRFFYVLNGGTETIGAYRIEHDGALTAVAGAAGLPNGATGLAAR